MGEGGRSCKPGEKPIDQRGKLTDELFDVQCGRDKVLIKFRGRIVRTITGHDADEIRAAVTAGDEAALQLLVARKTGNFKRGDERR